MVNPLIDPLFANIDGEEVPVLDKVPSIVVIIDEFADMMMVVGKKVEQLIARIAQKARARGNSYDFSDSKTVGRCDHRLD